MFPGRRSWILLAVAIGLLVAGIVLQRFAEGGDSTPDVPDVPDSELTPAATASAGPSLIPGPSTTTGATRPAGSTPTPSPTPVASAERRDLSIDEARGGHTLERHVGKSDAELLARLKAEPDISAASTYPDRATAERVVARVLSARKADVTKWENRTGSRPNLALRLDFGEVIGRSIEQGKTRAIEVEDAVVVLRWAGSDWYVLTSYPEDR